LQLSADPLGGFEMRMLIASFLVAAMGIGCAESRLFTVRGDLAMKPKLLIAECGTGSIFFVAPFEESSILHDFVNRFKEVSDRDSESNPIIIQVRGHVDINLPEAYRHPLTPRWILHIRQIDSMERGSCAQDGDEK